MLHPEYLCLSVTLSLSFPHPFRKDSRVQESDLNQSRYQSVDFQIEFDTWLPIINLT